MFPVSDHCDGRRFFNPGHAGRERFGDFLKWRFSRRPPRWPERVENTAQPRLPASPRADECAVTFVGHATFLLQFAGINVLTDPIWSESCSPVPGTGLNRVRAPGLAFSALPRIGLVLLSHNHYDHCDLPTLRRLAAGHAPLAVTTLGNHRLLARAGFRRVVELDWWQEHRFAEFPGGAITCVPAQHFAACTPFDRNRALWGGFVIATAAGRIYFAGDSGYGPHFAEIGEQLGPCALALLPIGAYEPRWFMRPMHMNPAEAIQAHRDARARRSLAMHFGCFPLADDAFGAPPQALAEARRDAGLDETEFALPEVGETRIFKL